jgi:hypothetical protein
MEMIILIDTVRPLDAVLLNFLAIIGPLSSWVDDSPLYCTICDIPLTMLKDQSIQTKSHKIFCNENRISMGINHVENVNLECILMFRTRINIFSIWPWFLSHACKN